jgi:hypothetical protein
MMHDITIRHGTEGDDYGADRDDQASRGNLGQPRSPCAGPLYPSCRDLHNQWATAFLAVAPSDEDLPIVMMADRRLAACRSLSTRRPA